VIRTSPLWWVRPLNMGNRGYDVMAAQEILGLAQSGIYDYDLAVTVSGVQKMAGLPTTGVLDEATARYMGPRSRDAVPPPWWKGSEILPGMEQYESLATPFGGEAGIRRLQGNYGIAPDGVIDQQVALLMGALGEVH
jgi:murein L,D-transpeptidase YcbB/YkuD